MSDSKPSQPLGEVELREAFEWTCDDCGVDQFERAIPVARDSLDDDAKEAFDSLMDGADGVHALRAPNVVTCKNCGKAFRTSFDDGEDGDSHERPES